jgi:microcystin-dependent protein
MSITRTGTGSSPSINYTICTSTTRPSGPLTGQLIFETDTNTVRFWSGSSWQNVGAAIGTLASLSGAKTAPLGWLLSYGQAVSRTSYDLLFSATVSLLGNPTFTNGSPTITLTGHGLVAGDTVYFTTTGALPTNFTVNTLYYVSASDLAANSFQLSATNGGVVIAAGSAGSGTHSLYFCPNGLGDGSTTFNVPDLRGNHPVGLDNIGGTAANRINTAVNSGQTIGGLGGEQKHGLIATELPAHTHDLMAGWTAGANFRVQRATNLADYGTSGEVSNGGNGTATGNPHNNLQPYLLTNWIVKI